MAGGEAGMLLLMLLVLLMMLLVVLVLLMMMLVVEAVARILWRLVATVERMILQRRLKISIIFKKIDLSLIL